MKEIFSAKSGVTRATAVGFVVAIQLWPSWATARGPRPDFRILPAATTGRGQLPAIAVEVLRQGLLEVDLVAEVILPDGTVVNDTGRSSGLSVGLGALSDGMAVEIASARPVILPDGFYAERIQVAVRTDERAALLELTRFRYFEVTGLSIVPVSSTTYSRATAAADFDEQGHPRTSLGPADEGSTTVVGELVHSGDQNASKEHQ